MLSEKEWYTGYLEVNMNLPGQEDNWFQTEGRAGAKTQSMRILAVLNNVEVSLEHNASE